MSKCLCCGIEIERGYFCKKQCRREFKRNLIDIIHRLDDFELSRLMSFINYSFIDKIKGDN